MTEYTSVYEIRDVEVIDGKSDYTISMTTEKIDIPDLFKEVASAIYRLNDEVFGVRYRVELKPEYKGYANWYDSLISEKNFMNESRNKLLVSRIIRKHNNIK